MEKEKNDEPLQQDPPLARGGTARQQSVGFQPDNSIRGSKPRKISGIRDTIHPK